MEVHHPHHITHKKKWKEYVIEGIMLFIAVSLGFFAENLRERQIEKHREISYLKNVHEDLRIDFKTVDTVVRSNAIRLAVLDTLFEKINNRTTSTEDLYYYIRNLALRATFEGSHVGFDQIKSAGGLRMVKSTAITSGIQEYEKALNSIVKLEELRERTLEQARFKIAKVMDASTLYEMAIHQLPGGVMRFNRPQKVPSLPVEAKTEINELLNLISIGLNTNRYLNVSLLKLKKIGNQLDDAIIKEYGHELD